MKYRDFYITYINDCGENEGGYFCEIYILDEYNSRSECDILDYFCIKPDELVSVSDVEYWIREYIDSNYDEFAKYLPIKAANPAT